MLIMSTRSFANPGKGCSQEETLQFNVKFGVMCFQVFGCMSNFLLRSDHSYVAFPCMFSSFQVIKENFCTLVFHQI